MRRVLASIATAGLALAGLAVVGATPSGAVTVPPNLLTVNQASVESSTAGFTHAYNRETFARSSYTARSGRYSLSVVSTTTKALGVKTVMAGQVVAPGKTYSAAVYVKPANGITSPKPARVILTYRSATGAALASIGGSWTRTVHGAWVRVGVSNALAPAGTASVEMVLTVATTSARQSYFADCWGMWRASTVQTWAMPPTKDSIAPTAPKLTGSANANATSLSFAWSTSSDNVKVKGYRLTLSSGATVVATRNVVGTSVVLPSLNAGGYSAVVQAIDTSNNVSAASNRVSLTLAQPAAAANLLTAPQASFEQSIAGVVQRQGDVTLTRTTDQSSDGTASLQMSIGTTGVAQVATEVGWTPVTPGQPYSASVQLRTSAAAGRNAVVSIEWYKADGSRDPFLSSQTATGPSVAITDSAWTTVTVDAGNVTAGSTTAPNVDPSSKAYYAVVSVTISDATAGDAVYADAWTLNRDTAAQAFATPTVPLGTVAAVLGDSYEVGSYASVPFKRWSSLVAKAHGWRELNLGRGGTGFCVPSTDCVADAGYDPLLACNLLVCPTIPNMALQAEAAKADVVLVSGGRNDAVDPSAAPRAAHVQDDVSATITSLATNLPTSRIVIVSPMWDDSTPLVGPSIIGGWEKTDVAAIGQSRVQYIDGAWNWLVGNTAAISVYDAVTNQTGDPQGIHPNDLGYSIIASHVNAAIG